MTTGRKENNGGITDELANYSILSFFCCVSQEYREETGIMIYPPRLPYSRKVHLKVLQHIHHLLLVSSWHTLQCEYSNATGSSNAVRLRRTDCKNKLIRVLESLMVAYLVKSCPPFI
jgi:hypothetical protein